MKLHPLSVPYRSITRGVSVASTLFFVGFAAMGTADWLGPFAVAALSLVGAALAVSWEVAYYRRFEYDLADTSLDIESGVLSRRRREIPLRRVQNVDIRRNVVQRALGVASVNLETAGGGQTEASLRYVDYDEAKRLQHEIRRRKRAEETEAAEEGREASEPEELLYEIQPTELAVLSAVSFEPRVAGLLFVLFPFLTGALDSLVSLTTLVFFGQLLVSGVVLWVASAMVTFARYYDFRLVRVDDELRYERGLLQRYDGSIPLDKVQTVTIRENLLMRLVGYASLGVETAGYAPGQGPTGGSEAAVPLATRGRAQQLAHTIEAFEDPTFTRPAKRARQRYAFRYAIVVALLTGAAYGVDQFTGWIGFWYVTPSLLLLAPVAAHLRWKHRGYHAGDDHVLTRTGFWRRSTHVVPYYRVQTVVQRETIFQRRWRLATVIVDTASSVGLTGREARAEDVDVGDARALRELVTEKLQERLRERRSRERIGPRE